MAILTSEKPVYTRTKNDSVGILNAASAGALGSNTNGVTAYTAGAYGGRVESLILSTDDTAAVNVFVYKYDGSTVIPVGIVNVPASSGNSGTVASVDALLGSGVTLVGLERDSNGKQYIPLMPNQLLKIACLANMTAAKKLYAQASGTDYTALA